MTEILEGQVFTLKTHPEYAKNVNHWRFLEQSYEGGREWFDTNIFKYFKEGSEEYKDRLQRAYRFNHTKEVVNLINKYIFKADVARSEEVDQNISFFWKNTTLQKRNIDYFMNSASIQSSIYGRVWIVIDSTAKFDNLTVKQANELGSRVYAYTVSPLDVKDLSYDDEGELQWILIEERERDSDDFFDYSGRVFVRYRLWTKNSWYLFTNTIVKGKPKVDELSLLEYGNHNLGIVPVTYLDHQETENYYTSPSLIADIAYLDRAVANYLSNIDAIIQDQTFSQLVMPSNGSAFSVDAHGESMADKIIETGTKRIFLYDGDAGNSPQYISPDPKQASVIITVINKIINEIYSSVGMAGERTKEDNSVGIDNSSGVAKAYDFERMNSLLANKAKSLEYTENKIVEIVKKYFAINDEKTEYVSYSKDFNVKSLYDELDIAEKLSIINAPVSLRQEQMKKLIDTLFPQVKEGLKKKLMDSVDEWEPEPLDSAPENKNSLVPSKENNQGQVV